MTASGIDDFNKNSDSNTYVDRAGDVETLLRSVQDRLIPFIRDADEEAGFKRRGRPHIINGEKPRSTLVESHQPSELQSLLQFSLQGNGQGKEGFLQAVEKILQYSVNTWDQGFLDKLYASTNAVGIASELILATLNTNVHVYQVSPVLTIIEKTTTRYLASLFGFSGHYAGGITVQGGSASNQTSVVIARNTLFPETKTEGHGSYKFVLFTSAHSHYSIGKAAQMLGFGGSNVWSVPVDRAGHMEPSALEDLVKKAKAEGRTPFYVNATAGTTVLGSFDPFTEIAAICKSYNLWFHIDASWGGPFIFSESQKHKLAGSHLADSIAINPHKMMGTPITCSFLLGADMRQFHKANTLPAAYLFHGENSEDSEVWDLGDLTLQCGRKGDAIKLFLGMTYYGAEGYASQVETAFSTATYLADLVCFHYAPDGRCVYEKSDPQAERKNSRITEEIAKRLIPQGFMVDFAPQTEASDRWQGKFFRAVINRDTKQGTVEGLVDVIVSIGRAVVEEFDDLDRRAAEVRPGGRVISPRTPGESGHGPALQN